MIILGLGLPDIQGHELLRMIRGRNDSAPIVVLSSRGAEAGRHSISVSTITSPRAPD